jgi:hypothetical protein
MHRWNVPVPPQLTESIAGAGVIALGALLYDFMRFHGIMPKSKGK